MPPFLMLSYNSKVITRASHFVDCLNCFSFSATIMRNSASLGPRSFRVSAKQLRKLNTTRPASNGMHSVAYWKVLVFTAVTWSIACDHSACTNLHTLCCTHPLILWKQSALWTGVGGGGGADIDKKYGRNKSNRISSHPVSSICFVFWRYRVRISAYLSWLKFCSFP